MSEIINQPTYKRQRFLLSFIRQLTGGVNAIDLQKLVFLQTMAGDSDYYAFVPYKYGPYSFRLAKDLDILKIDGYLTIVSTPDGTRMLITAVEEYPQERPPYRIAPERGNDLIHRAYLEYPYYAINSKVTGKLFRGEEPDSFNKEKQAYAQTMQILFTIGYEGKSIEAFINILLQNDVLLLCDVRKNPQSRKFGFSRGKLERITQTVGIKYVHMPELGIESDKRCSLETPEDYRCLFADYEETLPGRQTYLDKVYTLLRQNTRIALMCFEHKPDMCHRHVIRDYIVRTHRVRSADL